MSKYINLLSEQIKESIETYIIENDLKPDDPLPSERKLSENFQVNRLTVRAALKRLRNEHHIYTEHGKGNFISPPKIEDDTQKLSSFSEGWIPDGYTTSSKVLLFKTVESPLSISTHLELSLGEDVYLLKRIRYLDQKPFLLETSYLPKKYYPNLDAYDFSAQSLYNTIQDVYHLKLTRIDQSISITSLTKEESAALDACEHDTAFCIKSTTFDMEKPIEYCITISCADRYMMTSTLKNQEQSSEQNIRPKTFHSNESL